MERRKFFKYVKYSCSIFKLENVIITALKRWQLRVDIVFLEYMFCVDFVFKEFTIYLTISRRRFAY